MSTVGKRIRTARKQNNMTLNDVKKATGLSTGNLSELENDKFLPSANALISFHNLFGVSIDWLLTGSEQQNRNNADTFIESVAETSTCTNYISTDEEELLNLYRVLSTEQKRDLLGYVRILGSKKD
ncbi:transcriptional regulator with XRE-family HTH domain [Desulfitispora alkaliphila]|uniref:helix-turn-helix domain-containing protein n=1 Tax=Desulfitispora alkaliphila TaxID=622674 RepID=UPI003D1D73E4